MATMAAPGARDLRVVQRRAMWALASREMRRVLGLWTQTLLPSVLTGVVFLAVFGGALGPRLDVAGIDYVRFILPGLLVMTVTGQAFANSSTSLFQAKNEGYIEESSPVLCVRGNCSSPTCAAACSAGGWPLWRSGSSPGRSPAASSSQP